MISSRRESKWIHFSIFFGVYIITIIVYKFKVNNLSESRYKENNLFTEEKKYKMYQMPPS